MNTRTFLYALAAIVFPIFFALAGCSSPTDMAQTQPAPAGKLSMPQALAILARYTSAWANMSGSESQFWLRTRCLELDGGYSPRPGDFPRLVREMNNPQRDWPFRLCVAAILLERGRPEAHEFFERQWKQVSKDVLVLFPEAMILGEHSPATQAEWTTGVFLEMLKSGRLVEPTWTWAQFQALAKDPDAAAELALEYPGTGYGRDDNALGTVCGYLADHNCLVAVPALLDAIRRNPSQGALVTAAAKLDPKAAEPILAQTLVEDTETYRYGAYDLSMRVARLPETGDPTRMEREPEFRQPQLKCLIEMKSRLAADVLRRHMDMPNVFNTLVQLEPPDMVEILKEYLGKPDCPNVVEAKFQLAKLTISDPVTLAGKMREILAEYPDDRSKVIVWELARLKDAKAVDMLLKLVKTPGATDLGRVAVNALGEIGDRRAAEPLIVLMKSGTSSDSITREIVGSLGKIGDRRAVPPLIEFAKAGGAPDYFVSTVVESLGKIGDPKAADFIADLTCHGDIDRSLLTSCMVALGVIRSERSIAALTTRAMESDDFMIVEPALEGLGNQGPPAIESLILLLDRDFAKLGNYKHPVRTSAADQLRRITGQKFGNDAKAWRDWLAKNRGVLSQTATATSKPEDRD